MRRGVNYEPGNDASLGLIYRLNNLWASADQKALSGNKDDWNFVLERIFCNLMYHPTYPSEENEKGEIVSIDLEDEDYRIFEMFKAKIKKIKSDMRDALKLYKTDNKKEGSQRFNKANQEFYDTLMEKDIWLRKLMMKLKLYLRQADSSNPSKSMWGGN